jgi:uncharacterized protein YcgI (DUF1989 family)
MSSLGKLIEGRTYPPGAHASGHMKKGQILRIIDVEGEQVADFISVREGDPNEYLDCVYTNYVLGRWKWHKGDVIYTNEMRPLWTIVDDTVELHYTGGGYCSRALRTKYKIDNNDGCRETLQAALKANGIEPSLLRECSCFNIFMNVQYRPDGTWTIDRPKSKAGDHIDLRAEMDLLWAVSICSEPPVYKPVNGDRPTPMRFEVYAGA